MICRRKVSGWQMMVFKSLLLRRISMLCSRVSVFGWARRGEVAIRAVRRRRMMVRMDDVKRYLVQDKDYAHPSHVVPFTKYVQRPPELSGGPCQQGVNISW